MSRATTQLRGSFLFAGFGARAAAQGFGARAVVHAAQRTARAWVTSRIACSSA